MTSRCARTRLAAPLAVAVALASLLLAGVSDPASDHSLNRVHDVPRFVNVVVRRRGRLDPGLGQLVAAAGGRVTAELPIADALAASVPAASLAALAAAPGVAAVTPDLPVHSADAETVAGGTRPVYRQAVGADRLASRGFTGKGVTVALIDTGVADLPELRGHMVPVGLAGAPCQSFAAELGCADGYGHGTFMAGLIASVAPDAGLLSVKVAGRDGSSDVSKVLAAIQWVVSHAATYRIEVLNLSLGSDSTQDWRSDPLDYAVERAWSAGITVVAAAGNLGPEAGTVTKPGDDPWVLTVGAVDDQGTPSPGDDQPTGFSGRGPTSSGGEPKPDLAAPGARLPGLRAPGSTVAEAHPGPEPLRGSGTSMATAVTSGVVAQLNQARPDWRPDRLKLALTATARNAATSDASSVGSGVVDGWLAATSAPPGLANQGLEHSSGRGSLDASRGTLPVVAGDGLLVTGERTAQSGLLAGQLALWDPLGFITGDWTAATWPASPWVAARFLPTQWAGGDDGAGKNWQGAWYGSWG